MPDTPIDVMLFAAGLGTRMRPLTDTRPKPLVQVAGQPLLDHALDVVAAAPHGRIVVNAHYLADQIIAHLSGKSVTVSLEDARILDTGGGLKAALPLLQSEAVATLNTDAVWTGANPLETLMAAWDASRMDALLLCLDPAHATGRDGAGDFTIESGGRIARGGPLVYSGAQIMRADAVRDWPEDVFSLNAVWDRIIATGRAYGVIHSGGWCDVGHPGGIDTAETLLARGA